MKHTAQTRLRVSTSDAELLTGLLQAHGKARRCAARKLWDEGMSEGAVQKWISDTFGLHSRQAQSICIRLQQIEKSWRERKAQKMKTLGTTVAYFTRLVHENTVALSAAREDHFAKPKQRTNTSRRVELLKNALFRHRSALDRATNALEKHKGELSKGRPDICFGTKRLARARSEVGKPNSEFDDLGAWRSAWNAARDGEMWIVGSGREPMGNLSCRLDPAERTLAISLTSFQSQQRLDAIAAKREKASGRILGKMNAKRIVIQDVSFNLDDQLRFSHAIEEKRPVTMRIARQSAKSGADAFYLYATFEVDDMKPPTADPKGCLGIDFDGRMCSWAMVDDAGNLRRNGLAGSQQQQNPAVPMPGVFTAQSINLGRRAWRISSLTRGVRTDAMRKTAHEVVTLAAKSGVPIAIGAENFAKRKKELGQSSSAQSLRASDYATFNLALHRAAARHGVAVLQSDTTDAALVGYAKYAQINGLSVGCSAAMLIARRAVLGVPSAAASPSGKGSKGSKGDKTALKKVRRSAGRRKHQERAEFPRSMPAIELCIERRPRDSAWKRIAQVMGPDQRAWRACLFGPGFRSARLRFHRSLRAPPPTGNGARAE